MEYISRNYNRVKKRFYKASPGVYRLADKNKVIIKYLFSGGVAATADFAILYALTDILGVWYILSASFAFAAAFGVSFCLQKFWTFRDNNKKEIKRQLGLYFFVGSVNLAFNAVGMYALVDVLGIMYMIAQLIMAIIIAIASFLIYRYLIFKKGKNKYL
jgi:dolichol-phosphate mannosyltransferase